MSDEAKSEAKAEQITAIDNEIKNAEKIIEQLKSSNADPSLIKEAEAGLKVLIENKSKLSKATTADDFRHILKTAGDAVRLVGESAQKAAVDIAYSGKFGAEFSKKYSKEQTAALLKLQNSYRANATAADTQVQL
jgi:FKBP-type peptidyl-prolyl cis-trans isomerase